MEVRTKTLSSFVVAGDQKQGNNQSSNSNESMLAWADNNRHGSEDGSDREPRPILTCDREQESAKHQHHGKDD